jgi:CBS domain containing-hemolysin-like protein
VQAPVNSYLGIGAAALLILANGWFVAAEFAYVAVRRNALQERAQAGDRRAVRAVEVTRQLSFMLSGAQLGITVTSLLLGYIAQPTIGAALLPVTAALGLPDEAAQAAAVTTALVLATAVQMIVGELAPKNLAIARPETFSLALATGVLGYLRAARPVIRLFDGAANRLVRRLGITPADELPSDVSPEELELIITESEREGTLTGPQAALLGRVLEFRTLRAADAMVPRTRVVSLDRDATCEDLRAAAVRTGHSRFPVCGESLDDVVGVVQAKDVLRVPPERRASTPVTALATEPVAVPETALLRELLPEIRAGHTPLVLVVDEHGGTAGVVTLEDIVEELVGSIQDEYDVAEPSIQVLPDGSFRVPGAFRIDEVARESGVALPPGDYDTVGGLVMARLGRVPDVGDAVEVEGSTLMVEEMDGRAVARVRLVATPPAEEAGE